MSADSGLQQVITCPPWCILLGPWCILSQPQGGGNLMVISGTRESFCCYAPATCSNRCAYCSLMQRGIIVPALGDLHTLLQPPWWKTGANCWQQDSIGVFLKQQLQRGQRLHTMAGPCCLQLGRLLNYTPWQQLGVEAARSVVCGMYVVHAVVCFSVVVQAGCHHRLTGRISHKLLLLGRLECICKVWRPWCELPVCQTKCICRSG